MEIFSKVESIVNNLTAQLTTAAVDPQVQALKSIILAYITAWVTVRGYMILAGKTEEPIKSLLFDAAVKMIVVIVVFSPTWISLVSSTIDGLNSWASGSVSLYTRLDEILNSAIDLSNKLIDQDKGVIDIPIVGTAAAVLVMFGFVIFAVPSILIIITTTVTLKIVIMISPIMIFTLMFSWFKQIFSKWIELVLNNTLTVLLVGVLLNALNGKYKEVMDKANNSVGNADLLYISISVLIVSLIIAWVVLMAKGVAQQLTFVSIEHLPAAAAKEGQQIAGNTARSATKATTKTIGAVSYASRSTADLVASAIKRFGRAKR